MKKMFLLLASILLLTGCGEKKLTCTKTAESEGLKMNEEMIKFSIATLIVIVIIQCIENYVLQPIIMSKSTRISPLLIIIGLYLFIK